MTDLYHEKLHQAQELLAAYDLDLWLIFVRETAEHTDPTLKLLGHFSLTWPTAIVITRQGRALALTGLGDDEAVRHTGLFDEVRTYTQSIGPELVRLLSTYNPQRIGINISRSDVSADGLTYGMYLNLCDYLADTPYRERLVSAEQFVAALRSRKTPQEVDRLRTAADLSMRIFAAVGDFLRPGVSEYDVAAFAHAQTQAAGATTAWDPAHCPGLNAGPNSPWGHVGPSAEIVRPGEVFHMDFGVKLNDYCSDHQRVWYCLRPDEHEPPVEAQHAFNAVKTAIRAAAAAVRPGVAGWEFDAIARQTITAAGYPEYPHALGHQVGRSVHDGGVGFYPRWERYGDRPYGTIDAGMVLTLELGVRTRFGYISLEEEILVTADGCEWIGQPQEELWLIR
ncbi:MAG: M24 family metallopeptidase [Chloroflexus sp.]|uniref:M24 family metallopeptidase n=1 Tax=Chloroflexus sp. TaxID=1904827 RepID=UPI00404998CE